MIGIGQNLKFQPDVTVARSGGTMDLDFAGAKSLTSTVGAAAVTFTRASTGTYVNSSGLISSAAINEPRLTYDPVTMASKGLLIEAAATNLLTYSEQFDNAAWLKYASSVTPNTTTAPDGTLTADLFTPTASSGALYQTLTSAAEIRTFSVYVKGSATSFTLYQYTGAFATGSQVTFNLVTGTAGAITNFGATSGSSTGIVADGNGWYRCWLTVLNTVATWVQSFEIPLATPVSVWGACAFG